MTTVVVVDSTEDETDDDAEDGHLDSDSDDSDKSSGGDCNKKPKLVASVDHTLETCSSSTGSTKRDQPNNLNVSRSSFASSYVSTPPTLAARDCDRVPSTKNLLATIKVDRTRRWRVNSFKTGAGLVSRCR